MILKFDARCDCCGAHLPKGTKVAAAAKYHYWHYLCTECYSRCEGNFKTARAVLDAVCIYLFIDNPNDMLDHHDWDCLVDLGLHNWP